MTTFTLQEPNDLPSITLKEKFKGFGKIGILVCFCLGVYIDGTFYHAGLHSISAYFWLLVATVSVIAFLIIRLPSAMVFNNPVHVRLRRNSITLSLPRSGKELVLKAPDNEEFSCPKLIVSDLGKASDLLAGGLRELLPGKFLAWAPVLIFQQEGGVDSRPLSVELLAIKQLSEMSGGLHCLMLDKELEMSRSEILSFSVASYRARNEL